MNKKTLPLNKIYNMDCVEGMKRLPENSIDLCVTSPPYNCGINYDSYNDNREWNEYYEWCREWLKEVFRVLKPDGRFCLNHYLSLGQMDNRHAPLMDLNYICTKEIGFKHHGLAVWDDITLTKRTAWGSWISASAPYVNCLLPTGLVYTKRGILPITEVFKGDKVVGRDGQLAGVISQQCRYHNGDVVKIITQSNLVDPLISTPEHHFLIREKSVTFKGKPYTRRYKLTDPLWKDASHILSSHITSGGRANDNRIFLGVPIDQNTVVPNRLDKYDASPEFYWFVGFYLAEGSLRNNPNPGKQHGKWDIYLTTHISEKEDVDLRLKALNINHRIKTWENHCRFEISSKTLYEFFKSEFYIKGAHETIGTKAHLKIIPEWVVQMPKEYLSELIDGYFTGDGCKFKKRKIEGNLIVSTSKPMLLQVQRILFKLGKYARITQSCCAHTTSEFNNIKKEVNIKNRYNLIWYDHITKYNQAIFEENMVWIQIKTVECNQYEGMVYDLTVEDTHSYLTQCGITHNSPYEGILILFKDHWHKDNKGISDIAGKEFMQSCSGVWKLQPEMNGLTEANFPISLPMRCIKLLTYKNDVVLDPFSGSATTAYAAKVTGRQYIGFELSENYWKIGNKRLEQNGLDAWVEPETSLDDFE